MKNKYKIYFLFLLVQIMLVSSFNATCFSQAVGELESASNSLLTVSGQLLKTDGYPLTNGLIVVMSMDSSLIKSAISDDQGHFAVKNLMAKPYLFKFSHVGFTTRYRQVSLTDSSAQTSFTISLDQQPVTLNEVIVKDKNPFFDIVGDRLILNLENNPSNAGGTTFDVLGTAPRITADPIAKTLSIDGKSGVLLYLNGKQVNLPANEIVNYLQSLTANSVSKLEILTNPPARYDAGSAGIILITTKGIYREGLTGDLALTAGAGRYMKTNGSLSLSLQTKRVQGSFLVTPSYRPTYSGWNSHQLFTDVTGYSGYSRSSQFTKEDNSSGLVRTAWDVSIGKKTRVGTVLQLNRINQTQQTDATIAYQIAQPGAPNTQLESQTLLKPRITNFAANVSLRQNFKNPQTYISADFDAAHLVDNSYSSAQFTQFLPDRNPPESYSILYPNRVGIKTAKLDFQTQHSKKGSLGAGLKYSDVDMTNRPSDPIYTSGFSSIIPSLARPFQYIEKTASTYSNVTYAWKNISLDGGLRLEHTVYTGQSFSNQLIKRDYTNLFPSVSLEYTTKTKYILSLAANRRIIRPAFDVLNPAYHFYNPVHLYTGNVLLLPQLNTTLQSTLTTPKRVSLTFLYSYVQNRITEVLYRLDSIQPTVLNSYINFNWEKRLALTVSYPLQISSYWKLQAVLMAHYTRYYSTFQNQPTYTGQSTAILRLNQVFNFNKYTANLNFVGRNRAVIGYLQYDPIWSIDAGIQRVLTEKATLKLNATDIFHTLNVVNYGTYLNTDIGFSHRYESQQILLSYTYRFGNLKNKRVQPKAFGSEAEQQRYDKGGSSN